MRTRGPFPGMDPWLESYWNGVHHTIISSLRRQAYSQLPDGLYAEIEENVYVVDAEPSRQSFRPDVTIFDSSNPVGVSEYTDSETAVAEPIVLTFPSEPVTEGRIEIRDLRDQNRLVTVIEVLSPTNKSDLRGRVAYIAKRDAYIAADANIVEIDLLRGGEHLIGIPIEYVDPVSVVPYKCAIRRNNAPKGETRVHYFRIHLRDRLPRIHVPLRATDRDLILDLQEPITIAYQEGRFGMRIDYSVPSVPPLSPADAAWAAEMIATHP